MNSPCSSPKPQRSASPSRMHTASAATCGPQPGCGVDVGRNRTGRFISGKIGLRRCVHLYDLGAAPSRISLSHPAPLPHILSTTTVGLADRLYVDQTGQMRRGRRAWRQTSRPCPGRWPRTAADAAASGSSVEAGSGSRSAPTPPGRQRPPWASRTAEAAVLRRVVAGGDVDRAEARSSPSRRS